MINVSLIGKKPKKLRQLSRVVSDILISNERPESLVLKNKTITNSTFIGISLKEAQITGCDFSHSIFINCYFRGAKFRGCNFTGCNFYECNFRSATFVDCKFIYTNWKETHIRRETILGNLPSWPNVAQELLINLRLNAISIGEYEDARYFLYESESLSREHLLKIVRIYSDYYKKYSKWHRVKALFQYILSFFEKYFWGYGEQPFRLLFSGSLVITLFSGYYILAFDLLRKKPLGDALTTGFELSLRLFTTNAPQANDPDIGFAFPSNWFMSIESLIGLIFISFLAASLHRRIATRKD